MSRSKDHARTAADLLERAQRDEDLKLRYDKDGNSDDATTLAYVEHLVEDWKAGCKWSDEDCEAIVELLLKFVVLPVRPGTTAKSPEVKKQQEAVIRHQGRPLYKKFKEDAFWCTARATRSAL